MARLVILAGVAIMATGCATTGGVWRMAPLEPGQRYIVELQQAAQIVDNNERSTPYSQHDQYVERPQRRQYPSGS